MLPVRSSRLVHTETVQHTNQLMRRKTLRQSWHLDLADGQVFQVVKEVQVAMCWTGAQCGQKKMIGSLASHRSTITSCETPVTHRRWTTRWHDRHGIFNWRPRNSEEHTAHDAIAVNAVETNLKCQVRSVAIYRQNVQCHSVGSLDVSKTRVYFDLKFQKPIADGLQSSLAESMEFTFNGCRHHQRSLWSSHLPPEHDYQWCEYNEWTYSIFKCI